MKIDHSSLVILITLVFLFHIKLNEKRNILDYISACDSLLRIKMKCDLLEKNHVSLLKNIIKMFYFFKQIVMNNKKWILYNNMEWKWLWRSEMNHHQPYQRQVSTQRKWCWIYDGVGRKPSIMSSFWKTKWLIPTSTAPNKKNWK